MAPIIAALALAGAVLQGASAPASQAGASRCPVSDDPTYGFTKENPVQIGGGALYVKARETRYMDALRGPDGQPVRYKRLGSWPQREKSLTILDHYEVTYEGLEKTAVLYLDAYHFWEQRAPKGFTCGQPFQLRPILDGFQASESLREVALEQGNSESFAPIPLEPGATTRGVMLDAFRLLALQAASGAGRPGAPAGTVILAYAVPCQEGTLSPAAIEIVPAQGPPPRTGGLVKDESVEKLLPGVAAPSGSVAALFPLQHPRPGDRIRISYEGTGCDGATDVLLPLTFTAARAVAMPEGSLPDEIPQEERRVLMQTLIDLHGAFTRATYAGGPARLEAAAIEAIKNWRAEPARINGAPVPSATLVEVRFK